MKKYIKGGVAGFAIIGALLSTQVHGINDSYTGSHRLIYGHMESNYNFDHIKSDILIVRDMLLLKLYEKEVSQFDAERLLQKDDIKIKAIDYISMTFYEKMKYYVPASFDFDGECAFLGNVIINGNNDRNDAGMYDFLESSPISGQAACCIAFAYHVARRNGYSPVLLSKGIRSFLAEVLEQINIRDFEKRSSWLKKAAWITTAAGIALFGYSVYKYSNQDEEEEYLDYMKGKCDIGADWAKGAYSDGCSWITYKWKSWNQTTDGD